MIKDNTQTIVVIGNGMVGHRFCKKFVERNDKLLYKIVTFCEEPRAAYNRVGLTSFFQHRSAKKLMIADTNWYYENNIDLHINDRACKIDRKHRVVHSENGLKISYDHVILATGSAPFVPPIDGVDKKGVFVYRTIEDMQEIIQYGKKAKRCAVIGGGLLGLEAAKAAFDLGLETHVVEFAPRLMPRQTDEAGSRILIDKIKELGLKIHLNKSTKNILGNGRVTGMQFADDDCLEVDMIIVSAGIRPRDELARECGLKVGERGGVVVNDLLQTSDPDIYAIGEVALHSGMIYGLVGPGYEMADIAVSNFSVSRSERIHFHKQPSGETSQEMSTDEGVLKRFTGADMSTKLKLLGIDMASFGNCNSTENTTKPLTHEDPLQGIYKKLFFNQDGTRLLGGILIGDASDYGSLLSLTKKDNPLPTTPSELLFGRRNESQGNNRIKTSVSKQICSCNNVSESDIRSMIRKKNLCSLEQIQECTSAGISCGGCIPQVTSILNRSLKDSGKKIKKTLCEHFAFTRQELFEIIKIKKIKNFDELRKHCGQGDGCEICKPTAASIFASLWNENITNNDKHILQDTNDRFLANIQRGGLYSVVPRVPGGEITPDKLIVLGKVAKKYNLYTKITGGQRIDLFGAQMHQLPDIWEELVEAGFESGHAYGKSVRTVKSCVGTTWCRYGVQDSVGFAIELEKRYRGIRSPHKLKFAVSGCVRECAEAQCKDVGLIATENGYNLYVCGNGGTKPRHAELLATDLDNETSIKYIDRFLMYYIQTADKLTRTSVWLDSFESGIQQIKEVVIGDKLGICEELEKQMQYLVDSYRCEWKEVVNDPQRRQLFRQFVNTDNHETDIEFVGQRDQTHPVDWPKNGATLVELKTDPNSAINEKSKNELKNQQVNPSTLKWVEVGKVDDFPKNGGAAIQYGKVQIAVYHFASRSKWYASQNMCPHMNAFVLSRGIIGSDGEIPKIACPLHKKTFSLETGSNLQDEKYSLKVFSVKIENHRVLLLLPPEKQLNALLATEKHRIKACNKSAQAACTSCG